MALPHLHSATCIVTTASFGLAWWAAPTPEAMYGLAGAASYEAKRRDRIAARCVEAGEGEAPRSSW